MISIENKIQTADIATLEPKQGKVLTVLDQEQAHPSRSSKYSLVRTRDLISTFEDAGFAWKLVAQEKCRGSYENYGTHLLAFEHPEITFADSELSKEIMPRLFLRNSYHGRSSLIMELGIFRFVCMNGLFAGTTLQSFRKKHVGINHQELTMVVAEMKRALSEVVVPKISSLKDVQMSEGQQMEFAKYALASRFRHNENFLGGEHEKLLTVNRAEDSGDSAWVVLNRVQENLGLNFREPGVDVSYRTMIVDENGVNQIKERKVSKIRRISEVSEINRLLFEGINERTNPSSDLLIAA